MNTWQVVKTTSAPAARAAQNSVFTVSNGYWGLNGMLLEERGEKHPTTIINGVYDLSNTFLLIPPAKEKRYYLDEEYFSEGGPTPAVANVPSPLHTRVWVANHEVCLQRGRVERFRQVLELRSGLYRYSFVYTDHEGRQVQIEQERFCDMNNLHMAWLRYRVTARNFRGEVRLTTGINGAVTSNVVGDHQFDVVATEVPERGMCRLVAETRARRIRIEMGTRQWVRAAGRRTALKPTRAWCGARLVEEEYEATLAPGDSLVLEKCMFVTTSEDARHHAAISFDEVVTQTRTLSFDEAYAAHATTWEKLWEDADIEITGDGDLQTSLRFCLFHLMAAAPRHTDTLNVPVKLLTGEYYQGNTFYDTDTLILPFYTYTHPEWARNYLHWRYLGLRAGRKIAQELGYPGAKLAWQAGPYGEECLGRWWHFTHSNIHINADVAYAMLQYVEVSGDVEFMWRYGIEFLVESARFYAARAVYDEDDGRYHYHDCAGPDEGHCTSTDNFYTNYLAQQTLRAAVTWLEQLRAERPRQYAKLTRRLSLGQDEPRHWAEVADKIAFLYNPQTKLFEQYEGFYKLKEIGDDLIGRRRRRKEWFAPVREYQAIHQPDVMMAMVLYREQFSDEVFRANHAYYYPRTMNFSSMSYGLNAIACVEVGDLQEAYKNLIISAGMDLDESLTGRGDTCHGLHGTACGAAWMAVVVGFAGVRMHQGTLSINPRLPPQWRRLRFTLRVRGLRLWIRITRVSVEIRASEGKNVVVPVVIAGKRIEVWSGARVRYVLPREA